MATTLITRGLACVLAFPLAACDGAGEEEPQQAAPASPYTGRIRWLDVNGGAGYIVGERSSIRLYANAIQLDEFSSLSEGDCVEFSIDTAQEVVSAETLTRLANCPTELDDWGVWVDRPRPHVGCESDPQVERVPGVTDVAVVQRVKQIIGRQFGVAWDCVRADMDFIDDLWANSLDIVELAMELEASFGLEITREGMGRVRTVADAIRHVQERAE